MREDVFSVNELLFGEDNCRQGEKILFLRASRRPGRSLKRSNDFPGLGDEQVGIVVFPWCFQRSPARGSQSPKVEHRCPES